MCVGVQLSRVWMKRFQEVLEPIADLTKMDAIKKIKDGSLFLKRGFIYTLILVLMFSQNNVCCNKQILTQYGDNIFDYMTQRQATQDQNHNEKDIH